MLPAANQGEQVGDFSEGSAPKRVFESFNLGLEIPFLTRTTNRTDQT